MPNFCAVVACGSRGDRDNRSFFRIPCIPKIGSPAFRELKTKRRLKWILALRRADLTETKLSYALICDRHFISGSPAKTEDVDNPDWVPSINMGYLATNKDTKKTTSTPHIQYLKNTDVKQEKPEKTVRKKSFPKPKELTEIQQERIEVQQERLEVKEESIVDEDSNSLSELIDENGFPVCGNALSSATNAYGKLIGMEDKVTDGEAALSGNNSLNRQLTFVNILKQC